MSKQYAGFSGDLESASCPTCGPTAGRKLIFVEENIGFYQCEECNLQFASPRFTEASMLEIYDNEKFTEDYRQYRNWSFDRWKETKDRSYVVSHEKIKLIKEYLPEGSRLLDVGCSIGLTVFLANRMGFDAEGVELSRELYQIATESIGAPVQNIQVQDFGSDKQFQGIIIWDVLEHLYDPVGVLESSVNHLQNGGYLFAQVPNHKGLGNRTKELLCRAGIRKTFKHFGFPWHIYSFDKSSITKIMEKVGLKALRFESWPSALMDARKDPLSRISIFLGKVFARTDYIIVVARKI